MIKSEIVQEIRKTHLDIPYRDAERIVQCIFDEIENALVERNRVELRGFGTFSVKKRAARVGRNPRTGASVNVPEKYVPVFRPGKLLRERVNNGS